MWLLDALRADALVMRLGAHAVELWRGRPGSMTLLAREALPARGSLFSTEGLRAALLALAAQSQLQGTRVTFVLESVYAPVLLADVGGVLWKGSQVEALLRHRFDLAYGGAGTNVSNWTLRWAHRFGDLEALGFALPPAVAAVLAEVARAADLKTQSWAPALAWGFDAAKRFRGGVLQGVGWWLWSEQDRLLVARFNHHQVVSLNPAASLLSINQAHEGDAVERLIASETARVSSASNTAMAEGALSPIDALPVAVAVWEGASQQSLTPSSRLTLQPGTQQLAMHKRQRDVRSFFLGGSVASSASLVQSAVRTAEVAT